MRIIPPVALSVSELMQINLYRNTLSATAIGSDSGQGPSSNVPESTDRREEGGSSFNDLPALGGVDEDKVMKPVPPGIGFR
jgi:hypothetical protein